jgi:hypothetical protein
MCVDAGMSIGAAGRPWGNFRQRRPFSRLLAKMPIVNSDNGRTVQPAMSECTLVSVTLTSTALATSSAINSAFVLETNEKP